MGYDQLFNTFGNMAEFGTYWGSNPQHYTNGNIEIPRPFNFVKAAVIALAVAGTIGFFVLMARIVNNK